MASSHQASEIRMSLLEEFYGLDFEFTSKQEGIIFANMKPLPEFRSRYLSRWEKSLTTCPTQLHSSAEKQGECRLKIMGEARSVSKPCRI